MNKDASDRALGVFGKLLTRRGAWAWLHNVWTCCAKVLEHWMISSLKIKLNCSWKFQKNWNVVLVLLERSWWAGFNGIYLVRFGFRMWEILSFKWFSSMISFHIWQFKKSIHTLQNNVHMLSFPIFVMGSYLGQRHKPH